LLSRRSGSERQIGGVGLQQLLEGAQLVVQGNIVVEVVELEQ
jgi:hypothetical protein